MCWPSEEKVREKRKVKKEEKKTVVIVRKYAQQVTLNVHHVRHLVQWKTTYDVRILLSHRIHFYDDAILLFWVNWK